MQENYHHGALRQALLDSALAILEEGQDLTLRAVARRAGVSHAAPYNHFDDRTSLLAAVAREGLRSLRGALLSAGSGDQNDPFTALVNVGVAYVRFAVENRALFSLMFSAELANRGGNAELEAAYEEAYEVVSENVRHLVGTGGDPDDVRFLSLRAWSTVHGLAHLILENQVRGVQSIDHAEAIARRVFRARLPATFSP